MSGGPGIAYSCGAELSILLSSLKEFFYVCPGSRPDLSFCPCRSTAAVIVNQALTGLGVEDEFEVHPFQGVSENDLRAELKPHTSVNSRCTWTPWNSSIT
jgi:hypothetical protein